MGELLNKGGTFDGYATHNLRPISEELSKGLAKGEKGHSYPLGLEVSPLSGLYLKKPGIEYSV